jgi:hypothetical protein
MNKIVPPLHGNSSPLTRQKFPPYTARPFSSHSLAIAYKVLKSLLLFIYYYRAAHAASVKREAAELKDSGKEKSSLHSGGSESRRIGIYLYRIQGGCR